MPTRDDDWTRRLRGAGAGSIVGGLALGGLSVPVSYPVAAGLVLALGVGVWAYGRRSGSELGTKPSIGIAAVGGIGLLEALNVGAGLGVGPLLLATLAIGAGVVDILITVVLGVFRGRSESEGADSGSISDPDPDSESEPDP